jgi:excisionase family DNA binding protein
MPGSGVTKQDGARIVNIKEAARYLGTTPATLYTRIWRREIPFIKLGRSVRFDLRDLDALIEASKVGPEGPNQCRRH